MDQFQVNKATYLIQRVFIGTKTSTDGVNALEVQNLILPEQIPDFLAVHLGNQPLSLAFCQRVPEQHMVVPAKLRVIDI